MKNREISSSIRELNQHQSNKVRQLPVLLFMTPKKQLYLTANNLNAQLTQCFQLQVTAFGGDKVINLLRALERHHKKFKKPPIGPIGAHVV